MDICHKLINSDLPFDDIIKIREYVDHLENSEAVFDRSMSGTLLSLKRCIALRYLGVIRYHFKKWCEDQNVIASANIISRFGEIRGSRGFVRTVKDILKDACDLFDQDALSEEDSLECVNGLMNSFLKKTKNLIGTLLCCMAWVTMLIISSEMRSIRCSLTYCFTIIKLLYPVTLLGFVITIPLRLLEICGVKCLKKIPTLHNVLGLIPIVIIGFVIISIVSATITNKEEILTIIDIFCCVLASSV